MIIKIERYSNTHNAVEVLFTAETKEEKTLLGALAMNAATFGPYDSPTSSLILRGKVS